MKRWLVLQITANSGLTLFKQYTKFLPVNEKGMKNFGRIFIFFYRFHENHDTTKRTQIFLPFFFKATFTPKTKVLQISRQFSKIVSKLIFYR